MLCILQLQVVKIIKMFTFINHSEKRTENRHLVSIKKLGKYNTLLNQFDGDNEKLMAWAKSEAAKETELYNERTGKVTVEFSHAACIPMNEVRSFHAILTDIVYARVLSPSSKLSSYNFCKTLLEPPKYEIQDVYRALSVIAEESDFIQSELYKNSNFIHPRNQKILYYDCTNYYFEIEEESGLKHYRKGKENRPNPIVGMGLFMDADGIPLAFDIFPGNQNDQTTLKPLENKIIKDFNCSELIFCSDAGLGSANNREFNNIGNLAYVVTQSLKKMKQEDRDIALNPTQFRKVGSADFIDIRTLDENDEKVFNSIYYKEVPVVTGDLDETLIVTYSPNEIDEEQIAKEELYDGFYAVMTNLEGNIEEIIKINRQHWEIEENFRIMKTEFEARPVYVRRDDRIKAHFMTCYISLLLYRLLEKKIGNSYTTEQLIETLRSMKMTLLNTANCYVPSYTRTEITDSLHKTFGFRTDYEFIKKSTMRSIIKQTKE